jgi:hypothetical protein
MTAKRSNVTINEYGFAFTKFPELISGRMTLQPTRMPIAYALIFIVTRNTNVKLQNFASTVLFEITGVDFDVKFQQLIRHFVFMRHFRKNVITMGEYINRLHEIPKITGLIEMRPADPSGRAV